MEEVKNQSIGKWERSIQFKPSGTEKSNEKWKGVDKDVQQTHSWWLKNEWRLHQRWSLIYLYFLTWDYAVLPVAWGNIAG